ncbi:MAG: hypothetical protein MUD01_05115 [Chloroflexaceae bacterium]|jgi:hypothetical protein|nr:hypothetical protein [Chloroflexaceae bacterium]
MPRHALDLIAALARDEASLRGQEFLAPLLPGSKARLRVRGLIYELALADARPGWWLCRATGSSSAEIVDEALPWQRGDYLGFWPALRLVLLEPMQHGTWLAMPFNPADAAQRFGNPGPRPLHLVEGGAPFERVVARVEGNTCWYDEPDRRADPATAEALRTALAAEQVEPRIAGLGAGEQAAYRLLWNNTARAQAEAEAAQATARAATAAAHTERRLRHALELGGARLLGYEPMGNGTMRVTWERGNVRSVTLVQANLGVITAGICLSGEDHRFDLTSIVGVVRESPRYAELEDF